MFLFKIFFLFIVSWVFVAAQHFFSLVAVNRGYSLVGAWVSHCGGFSRCRAQALGHANFSSCGMWAQELWLPGSRAQAQ